MHITADYFEYSEYCMVIINVLIIPGDNIAALYEHPWTNELLLLEWRLESLDALTDKSFHIVYCEWARWHFQIQAMKFMNEYWLGEAMLFNIVQIKLMPFHLLHHFIRTIKECSFINQTSEYNSVFEKSVNKSEHVLASLSHSVHQLVIDNTRPSQWGDREL